MERLLNSLWFDMTVDEKIEQGLTQKFGVVRTDVEFTRGPERVRKRNVMGAISLDPKTPSHEIKLYKDLSAFIASRQQPVHIPVGAERRALPSLREDSIRIADVNALGMAIVKAREGTYLYRDGKVIPVLLDRTAFTIAVSDNGDVLALRRKPGSDSSDGTANIVDILQIGT